MQSTLKNNINSTLADVLMINDRGIMISVQGQDYFLSYNRVPWMKNATINEVLDVRMSGNNAIEWPKLTTLPDRRGCLIMGWLFWGCFLKSIRFFGVRCPHKVGQG